MLGDDIAGRQAVAADLAAQRHDLQALGDPEGAGRSAYVQLGDLFEHLRVGLKIANPHPGEIAGGRALELARPGMEVVAALYAGHRLLGFPVRLVDLVRRGIHRQRQGQLGQVQPHVVGPRRGKLPSIDHIEDVPAGGAAHRLRELPDLQLVDGRIEGRIEGAGQQPAEFAARLRRGALRELLGDGAERRPALQLLVDAIGTAFGLIGELRPVDRHEDIGDTRFRLADVGADTAEGIVDLGLGHVDLGPHAPPHDLGPGDLCLDLLDGDVEGNANALDILLELAARHAGGALDVAEPLLQLGVGSLQPQALGVLDLQLLVDHLAQHLRGHALAQFRAVLQSGRADGEQHALGEVEIGDGVIVDAREHA